MTKFRIDYSIKSFGSIDVEAEDEEAAWAVFEAAEEAVLISSVPPENVFISCDDIKEIKETKETK